jgi:hypothetical protein
VKPKASELWGQRVDQMGLSLKDSPLQALIDQLYSEMEAQGLSFRPPCYIANEWGCPDGVPLIGVPFYLVDPRLHSYEEEHADDLEDAGRIMAGLRHEAGHAINYAYKFYDRQDWTDVFGDFKQEYRDDYKPKPFSKKFVRHLPGWYAQKHPDEDFAETFAVWMTPGLAWRDKYKKWPALKKLDYLDRLMKEIGRTEPVWDMTHVAPPEPNELGFTVGQLYEMRASEDTPPVHELGGTLDEDLREIFAGGAVGADAAALVWDHRHAIMRSVSGYEGSRMYVVKAIIDFVTSKLRELGLRAAPGAEIDAGVSVTAIISTLTSHYLQTGHLVPDPDGPGSSEDDERASAA